ncbi:MAG: hypothetical protein AAGL08_10325 [Cyanobacteria bacterium J06573_11]
MSNPVATETFGQARQGSVAAIIQVLNERLADAGIRTRAVVADGMLQVLCEAQSTEQLEKQAVVSRVREILENINPHRIRRVNINSRLVKEEQLLWLEEINRDPDNALLWSEVITLKQPFFLQRWIRDRNLKPAGPIFKDITEPTRKPLSLSNRVIGGAGIAVLILGTGWLFREDLTQIRQVNSSLEENTAPNQPAQTDLPPLPDLSVTTEDLGQRAADTTPPENPPSTTPPANSSATTQAQTAGTPAANNGAASATDTPTSEPADNTSADNSTTPAPADSEAAPTPPPGSGQTADAFAEAVRIANIAAADGQTATTAAQWLDLAARWQRASDLMAQIPEGNAQYDQAKARVTSYADNSKAALAQAAALQ